MGRRTLLLLSSILIAAVGTGLVFLYVKGAATRAEQNVDLVDVLTVKSSVPAGTSVDEITRVQAWTTIKVARGSLMPGALASTDGLSGKVTTASLFKNEPLATDMFGAPGTVAVGGITPGKTGISVQLSDPARSAGTLQVNSQIAVFVVAGGSSRLVLPRTRVLAIGNVTAQAADNGAAGGGGGNGTAAGVSSATVQLAVDPQDAAKVVLAASSGTLYFALLGEGADIPANSRATLADLGIKGNG